MQKPEQVNSVREGERAPRGALHGSFAALLELGIEWMVRTTGRRIRRSDASWLKCFLGEPGLIGTGIYQRIADQERLKLRVPPTAGLIPDLEALRGPTFDPGAVDSRIRHFYEHAAEYHLEVWSEVCFVERFFSVAAGGVFEPSHGPIEFSDFFAGVGERDDERGGATVRAGDREGGVHGLAAAHEIDGTGDLRGDLFDDSDSTRRESVREGDVSVPRQRERVPAAGGACGWFVWVGFAGLGVWKIGFLPPGGIGAGTLASAEFHDPARIVPVYVDPEGVLRTGHKISFVWLTILGLHYKMTPLGEQKSRSSEPADTYPAGQVI